jgi:hypothetical protein
VEDDYWRALFDLKGALVTISVLSFDERPISTADARRLLVAFGQSVRAANSGTSPAPPAFGTQLVGLFRGGAR